MKGFKAAPQPGRIRYRVRFNSRRPADWFLIHACRSGDWFDLQGRTGHHNWNATHASPGQCGWVCESPVEVLHKVWASPSRRLNLLLCLRSRSPPALKLWVRTPHPCLPPLTSSLVASHYKQRRGRYDELRHRFRLGRVRTSLLFLGSGAPPSASSSASYTSCPNRIIITPTPVPAQNAMSSLAEEQ
jgi:hypothetical protein